MHKHAMGKTIAQARLILAIGRSGMTETKLAEVFGVSQSTVSRLKNGKIAKISVYQQKLDALLGRETEGQPDDLSELIVLAQSSPALREALIALQRLMRENA
jgi:transcriptional regulator with XRE-family HTH domain